jgi:crossover junction endodeoxyribonuclease RusA
MRLELPFPPSVNHYWRRAFRHGKQVTYLSKAGKRYKGDVRAAIVAQFGLRFVPFVEPVRMEIVLRPPSRRKADAANYDKAIPDALEAAGILENDRLVYDLRIRWDVSETGEIITTPGGTAFVTIEPIEVGSTLFSNSD